MKFIKEVMRFITSIIELFYKAKEEEATHLIIPEVPLPTKPQRKVTQVFIHCSASDNPKHDNIQTITKWHLERGFVTIGYHFVITNNGTIHTGRNIEMIPAAQEGHNTGSIAICLTGLNNFSQEQFASIAKFCRKVNNLYFGEITFHGHCEVSAKTCPNFDYKSVLKLNSNGFIER